MKSTKSIPVTLLVASLLLSSSFFASAQKQTAEQKQQNKEVRQQAKTLETAVENQQMQSMLAAQTFAFDANLLVSSINPLINNIELNNTLYGIWVRPERISVYLPVYGANSYTGVPTLLRQLSFDSTSYTYKITKQGYGWAITITTTDVMSGPGNTYTFNFTIPQSGNYSTLVVSSAFAAPVTFQGDVVSL